MQLMLDELPLRNTICSNMISKKFRQKVFLFPTCTEFYTEQNILFNSPIMDLFVLISSMSSLYKENCDLIYKSGNSILRNLREK